MIERVLAASVLCFFAASCGGAVDEQAPLVPLPPPVVAPVPAAIAPPASPQQPSKPPKK